MQLFQDVKEQIRRSIDLVDLVSEHVALKRAGRNLKGLCPFHREDTPSFNVLPDRQIFKCFGCNAGGDVFKFVQLREGVGFGEAVRILADRAGVRLEPRSHSAPGQEPVSRHDIGRVNEWAAGWFHKELLGERGAAARAYLEKRRISQASAEQFQIGLAVGDGRLAEAAGRAGFSMKLLMAADLIRNGERGGTYESFRDRLMFPIRDASRRCLGFGGRTLVEAPAKYLNTGQTLLFDKGRCLFGLDQARNAIGEQGEVVVVEGYTDCIACHQHGFRHVVATLGTAATDEHMAAIRRYVDGVVLFFDSDAAGEAAAERATAIAMQQNLRVRLAKVPEGKDPADYLEVAGAEGFAQLLNSACDALRFLWERTLTRFQSPSGGQGPRRAVTEFVRLVGELGRFRAVDAIQRGLIINQVARLLGLPSQEVSGIFATAAQPAGPKRAGSASTGSAGTGSAGPRSSAAVTPDMEQTALSAMLGILICRPDLASQVTDVFRAERFQEAGLRSIAERLLAWPAGEESDAAALIGSIESPEDAGRATELVFRAEKQEQHEENLQILRQRLAAIDAERAGREASQALLSATPSRDWTANDVNAGLAALHQGSARRHGFSPLAVPSAGAR